MAVHRTLLLLFLVSSCFISLSHAHDYWFEPSGDDYLLHRGHRFSQHGGEKEVPYDSSIITGAFCLRSEETNHDTTTVSGDYPARLSGPCLAIMATADSGYWSQTLTGTKNQPKDELFAVLRSWHAIESVKRVEVWNKHLLEPISDELELVFTKNPFLLESGKKLRLIVMLNGKPVQGVNVAYDGDTRGTTGDDGRINIRIRHKGLQVITASLEKVLDNKKADKLVRSTILMFELKE